MFLAAISHDFGSVGHRLTGRTVLADSSQDDNDDTFKYLYQMRKKNQKASIDNRNIHLHFYNGSMQLYLLLYCNVSHPKT